MAGVKKGVITLANIQIEECPASPPGELSGHCHVLQPPNGPTAEGVCRYCGDVRLHHVTEDRTYDLAKTPKGRERAKEHAWKGFIPQGEKND